MRAPPVPSTLVPRGPRVGRTRDQAGSCRGISIRSRRTLAAGHLLSKAPDRGRRWPGSAVVRSIGIALAVLAFACPPLLPAQEPVEIALIVAQTGKAAQGSEPMIEGTRFAIERINAAGGLLGRRLELLEIDNRSTAIGSKLAARRAVESQVVTVLGANWSSHSLAMAPTLQAAGIPMITPISTSPKVTLVGDHIFRVCFTDVLQSQVLARFALQDLKAATAGLLVNVDDQYSESLAQLFVEAYEKNGGEVVFRKEYLEKQADFTSFLDLVRQKRPDVLFHPGHTKVSAFVLKQAREGGLQTQFLGGDGWNDLMFEIAGEAIEGSYYTNHWHPDSSWPESRRFVATYREHSRRIHPTSALAHDAVYLFADAVRRANSFDRRRLRDAIAATRDFRGVTGRITFDHNGDPIKPVVILQFANGGSRYVRTVEP